MEKGGGEIFLGCMEGVSPGGVVHRQPNPHRILASPIRPPPCHQIAWHPPLHPLLASVLSTLEATQGQIVSQSGTDAISGGWHLNGI